MGEHYLESKKDYVQEVISGLKSDTSYEFTVTVNNGVSDQDDGNEKLRSCELETRTMEGSKLKGRIASHSNLSMTEFLVGNP